MKLDINNIFKENNITCDNQNNSYITNIVYNRQSDTLALSIIIDGDSDKEEIEQGIRMLFSNLSNVKFDYQKEFETVKPTVTPEVLLKSFQNEPDTKTISIGLKEEDIVVENNNVTIVFPYEKALDSFNSDNVQKAIKNIISNITDVPYTITGKIVEFMDTENYLDLLNKKELKKSKIAVSNFKSSESKTSGVKEIKPENQKLKMGYKMKSEISKIADLSLDSGVVCIAGEVIKIESREIKNNKVLLSMDIADDSSAITCKTFIDKKKFDDMEEYLKESIYVKVEGQVQYDTFSNYNVVMFKSMEEVEGGISRLDDSLEKRVELHLYTQMSALDGFINVKKLVKTLKTWGHKGIGITDKGVVQSFPDIESATKGSGIRPLYGMEMKLLSNNLRIITKADLVDDFDNYIVFDLETTGLSNRNDRITEIGGVKVENGKITKVYNQLVNPERNIPQNIIELTGITNEMVANEPTIDKVLGEFLEFCGDYTLVAHNADFDIGFLRENCLREGLGWNRGYMDTLPLARAVLPNLKNHRLNTLSKELGISLENHHRASDDAKATAEIFLEMKKIVESNGISFDKGLNSIETQWPISRNEGFNGIVYAKNLIGLKSLYYLVSESSLKYFHNSGGIPRFLIDENRDGLLLGSGNHEGELFRAIVNRDDDSELMEIASYYDFLEVQPVSNYIPLIEDGALEDVEEIKSIIKKICDIGEKLEIPVVATGDSHYVDPDDYLYRNIILEGQGKKRSMEKSPRLYLRTTTEMMNEFKFLGSGKSKEIVVDNSNRIMDMIEEFKPIPDGTFPPVLPGSDDELRNITYTKAKSIYGDDLPEIVKARLDRELNSIIANGYAVLYIIAQKLVWKSNDDGYLVGSRGSVGSSFVATMAGITEVNPLIPHYICPECKNSEFIEDTNVGSGVDLPDKKCPVCGHEYEKDGHNIPFEVFLGFEGDKEPDIDLNFAGEYQTTVHKYTEELFGKDKVFRAGTIGTIAENTAFGYILKYFENRGESVHPAQMNRIRKGIVGVKRTSGQHPGGIMIVPKDKDIYDFSPVQHPADKIDSQIITTHFDYGAISGKILKLDLLGHDVPSIIKMLSDLTGVDPLTLKLDDKETMSIFSSADALKPIHSFSSNDMGTLGIPEFGTSFVRGMLRETKPTTMSELIRISGLSHGTDVWLGNAQKLIQNGTAILNETICTRDDIMTYLISKGLDKKRSFKIMEAVRKGKPVDEETQSYMASFDVPQWYIDSCLLIKYLFPRAHAVAYVLMSFRIAYFKVHYPEAFYATYFTTKISDFPGDIVYQGIDAIREKMASISAQGKSASSKDLSIYSVLEVAEEMCARGISMAQVEFGKSDGLKFKLGEKSIIIPPFRALEGVSDAHSIAIYNEYKNGDFLSIQELTKRTKINKVAVEALKSHGTLAGIPDTNQMSFL